MPQPAPWDRKAVPAQDCTYQFGRCEISLARREITVGGQPRALQPQPFDVLVYLIEHRERVVRTDELLDRLWSDAVVEIDTVSTALSRIRRAIADSSDTKAILTHHRVGYRFVAPVLRVDGQSVRRP
ncbi:winged helix-turn-helix domain-containing protein [Methylibium rhizosphaerae]|uniref:winged helix-turn-helix domain-containing protein n=1 Tax=Methylibium rhizosphaerae TaxID=2570323 RepID=UPI0015E368E2|nr:winged helix-turn-helix domain-containing protein [Methylibium rhizosphaerae]